MTGVFYPRRNVIKLRVLAILLCVAMAFGLCACTGNGNGEEGDNNGGFLGNLIGGDKENDGGGFYGR